VFQKTLKSVGRLHVVKALETVFVPVSFGPIKSESFRRVGETLWIHSKTDLHVRLVKLVEVRLVISEMDTICTCNGWTFRNYSQWLG